MASANWTNRSPNSAAPNGNLMQPISMTTIAHHGNWSPGSTDPKRSAPPPAPPRPPPPATNGPRPSPPKDDYNYVPLCDPHFRLPWIELGIGILCALLSLCLMIAGLSRGSVVGEDSVKTRNYSAVYVGIFFLLVAIGLNVAFAFHFMHVRRRLKHCNTENEHLTDSQPLNQARQSYPADNLAFSGDEHSKRVPHASYPSQPNGIGQQYSVPHGQEPNYNATQEKVNLGRQSVSHGSGMRTRGPQSAELRAYGSSQPHQIRGAMPSNNPGPQNPVRGMTTSSQAGRVGAYGRGNPDQVHGAAGFNVSSAAQEKAMYPNMRPMIHPTGAMPNAQVRGAHGSTTIRPDASAARTDRPPPTYVGGSEHSSSPPSYRTYNNEPQSLSKPVAQASRLSDAQQRAIIERRQQRQNEVRGSTSFEMKVDVHPHK